MEFAEEIIEIADDGEEEEQTPEDIAGAKDDENDYVEDDDVENEEYDDPINSTDVSGRGISTQKSRDAKKMTMISTGSQADLNKRSKDNMTKQVKKAQRHLIDFEAGASTSSSSRYIIEPSKVEKLRMKIKKNVVATNNTSR